MIRVDNLSVDYIRNGQYFTALSSVSFNVEKGEIFCCLGPSGCGKTTLLMCISGLIKDYTGSIFINESNIREFRPNVGLVLQEYGLMPWKSVFDNIELGLLIKKVDRVERESIVMSILNDFKLYDIKDSYPSQISGGQKQRVAIARALVLNPDILLMDEPFSALDAITREEMQYFLLDLWLKTKVTILLVTHSVEEAVYLGNRIAVMSSNPGRFMKCFNTEDEKNIEKRMDDASISMCRDIRNILKGGICNEYKDSA